MDTFLNLYLKIFFLLTPFFVLSIFLTLTKNFDQRKRRRTALKVTLAIIGVCFFLLFFGRYVFTIFGITIDAFRVGAGSLLFLSAVSLVQGSKPSNDNPEEDFTVVPLAIPVTVGPATTGVILILGGETGTLATKIIPSLAMLSAILTVGLLLYISGYIEKFIGQRGLTILSKITGLILASIAAQMIFAGIKNLCS